MHRHTIVWRRLGIALSILWLVSIAGWVAFEWLTEPPVSGYFIEVVVQQTGESFSSMKGNMFADLIPIEHRLKWKSFILALLVPVVALWLVGLSVWWVSSGFTHERT